jgi:hypothetical protein
MSAGPQQADSGQDFGRMEQRPSPTREVGSTDESFINLCFPDPQHPLRPVLRALLGQIWLLFNEHEPTGAFDFLLLNVGQSLQQCTVCFKFFSRRARALEHIRAHLSHQPFRCSGGFPGCSRGIWYVCSPIRLHVPDSINSGQQFHSQEAMKAHQRQRKVQCERW